MGVVLLLLIAASAAWAAYAFLGYRSASQTNGTVALRGIESTVQIFRDDRDVPHIIANSDRDVMFGQGYAEASDRLFQMDLLRRYVYGRLAEVLGSAALSADETARVAPIGPIVQLQWQRMDGRDRALVQSFSDGVNAAMRREALPVEFRLLQYKPQPWRPQDSLAVGMATVLDLIDRWDDVIRRDAVAHSRDAPPQRDLYSITDPAYDAPIDPRIVAPVAPLSARMRTTLHSNAIVLPLERALGASNEWALGARKSRTGHALLANDPHLRLGIPGVWYLADLRSRNLHVAGACLAGTPGVILGHNENVAWGATNGTVVTEAVYRDSLHGASARIETFHVRFANDVHFTYYSTAHGFVAEVRAQTAYAVDWNAVRQPASPLPAFLKIDESRTIADAVRALRTYPGPPQNFAIADTSGAAAYQLAGLIPNDPLWGLRVHEQSDPRYAFIPFDRLPRVAPARDTVVFTANDRMYGAGYPLRLSPNFAAPYRAHRIEHLLETKPAFSVHDLAGFQNDTLSIPERDIARATVAAAIRKKRQHERSLLPYLESLTRWNGRFDPASRGAAIAWELRRTAVSRLAQYAVPNAPQEYQASANNANVVLLLRVLRERPRGWWPDDDYDDLLLSSLESAIRRNGTRMLESWGEYGKVTVKHPLSPMGFSFLNGATFPGDGDKLRFARADAVALAKFSRRVERRELGRRRHCNSKRRIGRTGFAPLHRLERRLDSRAPAPAAVQRGGSETRDARNAHFVAEVRNE